MEITSKQHRKIEEALMDAFPSRDALERMVAYQLDQNLATIASGDNFTIIVFNLVKWARSTGCIAELITKAHTENPGNELLKQCVIEFQQAAAPQPHVAGGARRATAQVWDVWQFDMDQLVEQCLRELLPRRGLVGIALPCDEDAFHTNFCERLRHVLGRGHTRVRVPMAVTPTTPPDQRVNDIQRLKAFPGEQNIICPVPLRYYNDKQGTSQIVADFWQELHTACYVPGDQRLIVVLFPSDDCVYPPDIIAPERPRFGEEHVFLWIGQITSTLGWPEEIRQRWYTIMVDECRAYEALSISRVYQHLKDTLELLHDSSTDYHKFLAAIEQRI
jgi:hypothetical protein